MIATLRKKNQVTIPATIIKKLGLHEGNDIQIVEKNGIIEIRPIVVVDKSFWDSQELDEAYNDYLRKNVKKTKTLDEAFEFLDSE